MSDTPETDALIAADRHNIDDESVTASAYWRMAESSKSFERERDVAREQCDLLLEVVKSRDADRIYNDKKSNELRDALSVSQKERADAIFKCSKVEIIAGELIAMIRINVMRGTFKECTIETIDKHLEPWIKKLNQ